MPCKWTTVCPLRKFEEKGMIDLNWRKQYYYSNFAKCIRYQMEKMGQPHPDNLLPNGNVDKRLK